MTTASDVARIDSSEISVLSKFCHWMLASLPRSDQRRWGEVYIRGLLNVPGRKSIRRIAELVPGNDADQSLQQFVNQSPWAWEPVRRALAEQLVRTMRPKALAIREVVFPKNGDRSVGVARQYAPPAGRVLNCQRALVVLLVGEAGACPINWRLMLPSEWDDDPKRRAKARLPERDRSQPAWAYALDMLDEIFGQWDLPRAPVLVDLTTEREIEPLLRRLEHRRLGYLARVGPATSLQPVPLSGEVDDRPFTVGQLAAASGRRGGTTVGWRDDRTGKVATSLFTLATVAGAPGRTRTSLAGAPRRSRQVFAEWPWGTGRAPATWLTNVGTRGMLDLVGLRRAWARSGTELDRVSAESGLRHFEGRSYPGWHHHVTLVSLAHAFRLMRRVEQEQFAHQDLRPYVEA
jgi:hypothetical protein